MAQKRPPQAGKAENTFCDRKAFPGENTSQETGGLHELNRAFIIAVGLSMDAFAVSVCKGLSVQRLKLGHALACGVYFGGFQG